MNNKTNPKSNKYGNDHYWCFLDDVSVTKEIAIWKGPSDSEEIIARASGKYDARIIIDALLNYVNVEDKKFGKRELVFLEFGVSHFPEPYSTMATNAIIWNDREIYEKLKSEFSKIYN